MGSMLRMGWFVVLGLGEVGLIDGFVGLLVRGRGRLLCKIEAEDSGACRDRELWNVYEYFCCGKDGSLCWGAE
jgi:hypothetical protein